ncbi:MAG: hypothetical protein ACK55J_02930, partial [Alphaproteobacteria bacterium]
MALACCFDVTIAGCLGKPQTRPRPYCCAVPEMSRFSSDIFDRETRYGIAQIGFHPQTRTIGAIGSG